MPETPSLTPAPQRLTVTHWLIISMAALGFAFDIYELLMLPLILGPALAELKPEPVVSVLGLIELDWAGLMFFVPALAGGVFGLLGGYLTDRLGRRFVLTWSILLYAVSAFLAGFSTSMGMLLFFRCTTFVGVCVEFVAAVAWLAELFPHPKQREAVLGWTQAFSSLGGLMVAGANLLAVALADRLPAIVLPDWIASWWGQVDNPHAAWRYTLMSGLIPAFPLLIIRPFLPESPAWLRKRREGTLKRPSFAELFQPALLRTTVVTTIMIALAYGAAFGAIQHVPRMVPGLPQVQAEVRQKTSDLPDRDRALQQRRVEQTTAASVQLTQEIGGLAGRMLLAVLAVVIISRRRLLRVFQVPGLIIVPIVFLYPAVSELSLLYPGMFLVGLLTVAQFSFWGNYLPRVYPTHLRGTGESFAANIGGRMIGTSAAVLTTQIAGLMPSGAPATKLAYAAAAVAALVYGIGFIASFWLPEPKQDKLPE